MVLDRADLISLVKGTPPYYPAMNDTLVSKAGTYIGGFKDEWVWGNLTKFSDEDLLAIYLTCKASW